MSSTIGVPSMPATQSSSPAAGFFVDARKGEVNELKNLLKHLNIERDQKRKRDIIKKVIACMTLGIDVSRLFTEMIMAIESKDIVVKKMVYLYLCNYAHKEPEMAIMCINSLRRECENDDPMVRGLALRSLCNLRLESILEYVEQPLTKGLSDLSAYVRKVAVIAVLKLHYLQATFVENNGYVNKLSSMLQDADADVVTNVLYVLNELKISYGGLEISQATVMHLLSRIGELSEWGLAVVLDIVSRYSPANEDETFAIMNLLDAVLRTANSGAVLGTIKCFMKLTEGFEDLRPQIWVRAKPPLLTLLAGGNPELQYALLKHLQLILQEPAAAGVFDDEYRQFFVRYNEAPHIKHLKVGLLPYLSNGVNARDICVELNEYVTDVDAELSRCALQAMGKIAIRLEPVAEELVESLMKMVDLDITYVRSEAFKISTDIIRVYPHCRKLVLPHISKCLKTIEDSDAQAMVLWTIGEYCAEIVEAPYLLEAIIKAYEEEHSTEIKLQLLTAVMKTFFRRAPETQKMLGRLIDLSINDISDQDVHDRGLMYYRLLNSNLDVAEKLFASGDEMRQTHTGDGFAESMQVEKRKMIMQEFNSLSVVFNLTSTKFIEDKYQLRLDNAPLKDDAFEFDAAPSDAIRQQQKEEQQYSSASSLLEPAAGTANLLDDYNMGGSATNNATQSSGWSAADFKLQAKQTIEPTAFQQSWGELAETFNGTVVHLDKAVDSVGELIGSFGAANLHCVASGQLPGGGIRLFLYGVQIDDSSLLSSGEKNVFLAQVIAKPAGEVAAVIKTDSTVPGCANSLASLMKMALQ